MDGATIGVSICEDIWYPDGPVFQQALSGGAEVIINISSSPYHAGKRRWRERMLATRASDNTVIVAYNNLVGGQDELVFDGDSLVFDENGEVIGGSSLVTGSFEYEHPIRARWSIATFVDSGNAFERSAMDAKTGAGLGARWQSPLGPIRIDLAHPFDDDTTDWRVHITLGPDL